MQRCAVSVVTLSSSLDVSAYVPDLDEWPDSWMIDQQDRAMGKAIVTDINWDESLRKQSAKVLVSNTVDEEGGPLLHNPLDPDDQIHFDSTCRKLYKFLNS